MATFVRFTSDDPMGLWRKDEKAELLGPEHPELPIYNFKMVETGELISLTDPFGRKLVAPWRIIK